MRRSLVPAVLLVLTAAAPACAHPSADAAPIAHPAVEAEPDAETDDPETDEPELDPALETALLGTDPNVIRFDDDIDAGPADSVVAPPKREDIPGFALFGTGESLDHDGPKLTLPDDIE